MYFTHTFAKNNKTQKDENKIFIDDIFCHEHKLSCSDNT